MRDEFVRVLTELAESDPDLFLLTGDLGFGVLTEFAKIFPNQFLNVGVAEQNLSGVAAGLALEGKTVFTYSIANFNTFRCLEQIRNDICYHNLNVKIVSVGGGFVYGPLGISHHATEDLAIMRAIPNLTVVAPGDKIEAGLATKSLYDYEGPAYLRLGRGGEPKLHLEVPDFTLGKAIPLYEKGEIVMLSTGGILVNVLEAREILLKAGIECSVFTVPTVEPMDVDLIEKLCRTVRLIVTVEEHIINGGLGSSAAEILAEYPNPSARLIRIGIRKGFTSEIGDQNYLRELNGLDPSSIAKKIRQALS